MICPGCNTVVDFAALPRVGRTKNVEVRSCSCGAPLAAPIVKRPVKPAKLITASSVKCFRFCPRKYKYAYVAGLRPRREAAALVFGTLWHSGMEAWWQGLGWTPGPADPFDLAKAKALLAGYGARWPQDSHEVLAIERSFEAPLRDSAGRPVRGWRIAGKVDGLLRQDGRVWLLEHKTTSEDITPGGDYWARLTVDTQISLYFDGAAALGHQVDGCLYDVVKKSGLKPGVLPTLDENGEKIVLGPDGERVKTARGTWRQTADSASGFVLQTQPETPAQYQARVLEAIAERPNDHYARAEVVRLDGELAAARDDLVATVRAIDWSARREFWPRNDSACFEYGRCPYWGLCAGQAVEENDYVHVENVHPELEAA